MSIPQDFPHRDMHSETPIPKSNINKQSKKDKPIGYIATLDKPISISEILVYLNPDVRGVRISTILIAKTDERSYLLRVRDILHYSPAAHPVHIGIKKELFGEEPSPDKEMLYVGSYRALRTELLDVIDNNTGTMLGPVEVPLPGTPVYQSTSAVTNMILGRQELPIEIGTLVGTDTPVYIDVQKLSRHCLIIGTTGTGKSWLRGVMLEKIHELGIPQIIFDPLGDYIRAVEKLGGINVRYGKDFLPPLYSLSTSLFKSLLKGVLTPLQLRIATRAFEKFKKESLENISQGKEADPWRLLDIIEEVGEELRARSETLENTLTRVESLLEDIGYPRKTYGLERYLEKSTEINYLDLEKEINEKLLINFDLQGMTDLQFQLTVATVLWEIVRLRRLNKIPPLIVSFDETHRIAPRVKPPAEPPPSTLVIRDLVRFGRHYGIGIIAITQFPNSIDLELVRLPATRFIFAIDSDQLDTVKGVLRDLPKELVNHLPRLEKATAFLAGTSDIIRHTLYVKISSKRTTPHGGETPKFIPISKFVPRKTEKRNTKNAWW